MDKEDLYTDLDSKSMNSGWSQKRQAIQTRKKGWIRRLKTDIDTGKVNHVRQPQSTTESAVSLPKICIKLNQPLKPKVECISNLASDDENISQSVLCMVCFNFVSIGTERVECQHCPVVIHCSCIENPLDYTSSEFKAQRAHAHSSEDTAPTSRDIKWTCAFCIHDIKKKNHDALIKYQKAMVNHSFKKAVVKLQSFFRMRPQRVAFQVAVASAHVLQRLHRNRHFRVAVMRERLVERRAVRVRVHEVIAYVEDLEEEDCPPLNLEDSYFLKLNTNLYPTTGMEHVPLPMDEHSIDIHSIETKEKVYPDLRRTILTNMFVASNGGADPAATLRDVDKGPYPPKTFFLTVTVHHSEDMRQLYRVDLPMREAHEFLFHEATVERMMTIQRVNAMFEGDSSVHQGVSKVRLYPPKPYVMFPACPGGVTITMTLSRVTEWPRAMYICDDSYCAENSLVWKQVSCMSHGMTPSASPSLPSSMGRLKISVMKSRDIKAYIKEKKDVSLSRAIHQMNFKSPQKGGGYDSDEDSTASVESLASVESASSCMTTSFPSIDKKHIHWKNRRNKVVTCARILWTLLPTPNVGALFGYLHFFDSSNSTSPSAKFWCVVLDKCLAIFKKRGDTKPPRECVNLTVCHFLLTKHDVIRIYRPSDRQVWLCQGTILHKRPDWATLIAAACQTAKEPD